ncbi:hypothetical protein M407DRAFT_241132 [Tulasnella calospora MUT 4182]|uniref:Elongation factor methyltransferase 7 n=1 Tax=Tulasnella calospora MUT 4182 TaxID=1051891 RepID=A0A0C3QWQ7_9AGAM|nr:hypothetical protein M407DRAFT_241132 [Tulasnella calospora MUT 4182]
MSDAEDDSLGLGELIPEPPRPPTPPPTFVSYTRDLSLEQRRTGWTDLTIELVGSHPLWGHYLWNAAKVCASFIDKHSSRICKDKTVLELGAGGALPSLVALLDGAEKVVSTDYPDIALDRCRERNLQANVSEESGFRERFVSLPYLWGTPVAPLLERLGTDSEGKAKKFDLVIMSDLIFNHSQHAALLCTCSEALSPSLSPSPASEPPTTPCLLVFYTHHRPHLADRDMGFFRMAQEQGWDCQEILTEKMEAMFPDDPGDLEVRSTVHGWILRRK